jgi:hypothetical protein
VRLWFSTNKHRFVPSTLGGSRSDCATQNMRLKREVDDLHDLLDREHLLIDWLQCDGTARDGEITELRQGLAVAEAERTDHCRTVEQPEMRRSHSCGGDLQSPRPRMRRCGPSWRRRAGFSKSC